MAVLFAPISFQRNNDNISSSKTSFGLSQFSKLKPLTRDVVSFSSKMPLSNDLVINRNFTSAGYKTTKDVLQQSLGYYVNGGYTADFYDVPGTHYLLAVPKIILQEVLSGDYIPDKAFEAISDPYPGFNFGQCIAKCGELRLHQKIEGVVGGVIFCDEAVSPEERWQKECDMEYSSKHLQQYSEHLERVNRLGQSAFDKFAQEIMRASAAGHIFDFNPNNLLISDRAINIIDPTTRENAAEWHNHGDHLAGMVTSLLDNKFVAKQNQQSVKTGLRASLSDPNHVQIRKEILKKALLAAHKINMPHDDNPWSGGEYRKIRCLTNSFEIAGLTSEECHEILENFDLPSGEFEAMVERIFKNNH